MNQPIHILGIESSCDDTAASVIKDGAALSNIIAGQDVHRRYGGVVPELASRAHQKNIVPTVDLALKKAGVEKSSLDAIAYTRGPGLLGSLLVGASFAKGLALTLNIPVIGIQHVQAHVMAHFIDGSPRPVFPFLCLTVSGGHTQIVLVNGYFEMEILGETLDDAAGEAFDKAAAILGLPYPGGPMIDKLAAGGNPETFSFPHPSAPGLDYSFSGLKTAILYFIRDMKMKDAHFIEGNKANLCASIQKTIVEILLEKLITASEKTGIKEIAIAGGVAANTELRMALNKLQNELNWNIYIPKFEYCTDNAAMIAIAGYYKFLKGDFSDQRDEVKARMVW